MHPIASASEADSHPDDITSLNGGIFVAFQNGVGPQGQPTSTTADSTIVEFNNAGNEVSK